MSVFSFLFSVFLVSCGVPGPPVPPTPKIPVPPKELQARQVGQRVLLRWILPRLHTDGTRMEKFPRFELYRAFVAGEPPAADAFRAQARLVNAIPPQLVDSFLHNEILVFPDVLGAALLREQAGRTTVYGIKAVNAKGQDAGFSNLVSLRVHLVARPLGRLETRVTEQAIELHWAAPEATTSGTPLEAIAGYQVYRSETGEEGSFALHGTASTAQYEDTRFRFGARYFYRIRTLAQFGADTVESDNSVTVEVIPRDLFAPAPPANLIIVAGPDRIDLTWDASPAADLAGYHVYRSRGPGRGYERLTRESLRAQSFVDTQVHVGTRYYYVVTAVDAEGNESAFSEEVSGTPVPPE